MVHSHLWTLNWLLHYHDPLHSENRLHDQPTNILTTTLTSLSSSSSSSATDCWDKISSPCFMHNDHHGDDYYYYYYYHTTTCLQVPVFQIAHPESLLTIICSHQLLAQKDSLSLSLSLSDLDPEEQCFQRLLEVGDVVDESGVLHHLGVAAAVVQKPRALLQRLQQNHHLLLANKPQGMTSTHHQSSALLNISPSTSTSNYLLPMLSCLPVS